MNTKRKIYLTLGIFGILFIVLVALAIHPLFKGIKKNSDDFISAKGEILSLEAEIENIKKIKDQYQNHQQDLEKITSLFISPDVPLNFLNYLRQLASDSGVLKFSISSVPAPKTGGEIWSPLYYQLSISSSFLNFSKFLEKLENCRYLIEIENLEIKRLTETDLLQEGFGSLSLADVNSKILIKVFTE